MDIVTYSICQSMAASAVSGVKDLKVEGTDLLITTNDGNKLTMNFPKPKDGVDGKDGIDGKNGEDGISVSNITIEEKDDGNHLIFSMSDGSKIDGGVIDCSAGLKFATEEDIDSLFK